jgi:hypothetical protein
MKPTIFAALLFLASSVLAFPSEHIPPLTKGLPPLTKGLPPPPSTGLPQTKGLPPPPKPLSIPSDIADKLPAGVATALPKLPLSTNCALSLLGVLTSPEALKCFPLTASVSLIPIILDPTIIQNFVKAPSNKTYEPVEQPFIQFADGLCKAPKCSDAAVQGGLKTLDAGCQDDIKAKNPVYTALVDIFTFYSPLHDSLCFQNPKKQFCWDESILTAINLPKSPIKIIDGGIIDSIAVADPPKVCTACNRAIVNTFGNFVKKSTAAQDILVQLGVNTTLIEIGVAVKCGIDFENGVVGDPSKH